MKMIITAVLLVMCLSWANPSNAAGTLSAQKITKVAFQSTGFFLYASDWNNPNSCSQDTAIVLLDSDPNYDKAYALLLTAYASGKRVSGYSNGCTTFDGKTYNTIRGYKYLLVE